MQTVRCAICGFEAPFLGAHLREEHGMNVAEYQLEHDSPVVTGELMKKHSKKISKRTPVNKGALEVTLKKVPFDVNTDVPEEACLPLPEHYQLPEHGQLTMAIQHVLVGLKNKRSIYVHGLPGSGKDALFHAVSAMTRTPGKIFQVQPEADIQSWFFARAFSDKGTFWEEGDLLKALRDGYVTEDGRRVPYMILLTDFDRAGRSQAEAMRLVMDSIKGRVPGPNGTTHPVLPGTTIVATGNTSGAGDFRGRMTSANIIDASIMDRFQIKIEFPWMDWEDEAIVVKKKFPELVEEFPDLLKQVGAAVLSIRKAIAEDKIAGEFSHRAICAWMQHSADFLALSKKGTKSLHDTLVFGWAAVSGAWPDPRTASQVLELINPHIENGVGAASKPNHDDLYNHR